MNNKELIAQAAYNNIFDGDIVFLDGGSTMVELAKLLLNKDVTIISNNALLKVIPLKKLILLPGKLLIPQNIRLSTETLNELSNYKFDKAFFGFSKIDKEGFYTSRIDEVAFKQKVLSLSNQNFAIGETNKKPAEENFLYAPSGKLRLITI